METTIFNGRLINRRTMGRSSFYNILTNNQNQQLYATVDCVHFDELNNLPLGTFVRVEGEMFHTRTGHHTLRVEILEVLHTPVRILPPVREINDSSYSSFADVELIRRRRYLQTIQDSTERETFITRSRIIQEVRNFFIENDYLEVETPILQPIYGGAEADPFVTHHNVLDRDLFLRIAPELYLRRLLIGGYERVFEIGRNFRNEGISTRHNPEFTFIEIYTSYADYVFSMDLIENLFSILSSRFGSEITYDDNVINLNDIRRIRFRDLVAEVCEVDISEINDTEIIRLFEERVEQTLIQPTIVYDYPSIISPLALRCENDDTTSQRFELYIGGMEIANAYSELNDVDLHIANLGETDRDFIEALEYGMPPSSGIGIGLDRLIMLFTNRTIRDVIYFPIARERE
jgi:lysyl-tRNA synthetase, class II